MKLTTTALATIAVISATNLKSSTALHLLLILDRTARGARCYNADLAEALGVDMGKTAQSVQYLRGAHWIATRPAKLNGKRAVESRPTRKALELMQRIQSLRHAVDRHQETLANAEEQMEESYS